MKGAFVASRTVQPNGLRGVLERGMGGFGAQRGRKSAHKAIRGP